VIIGPQSENWSIKISCFCQDCPKKAIIGLVLSDPMGIPLRPVWFLRAVLGAVTKAEFSGNNNVRIPHGISDRAEEDEEPSL
jgi:hypothetical protein